MMQLQICQCMYLSVYDRLAQRTNKPAFVQHRELWPDKLPTTMSMIFGYHGDCNSALPVDKLSGHRPSAAFAVAAAAAAVDER